MNEATIKRKLAKLRKLVEDIKVSMDQVDSWDRIFEIAVKNGGFPTNGSLQERNRLFDEIQTNIKQQYKLTKQLLDAGINPNAE